MICVNLELIQEQKVALHRIIVQLQNNYDTLRISIQMLRAEYTVYEKMGKNLKKELHELEDEIRATRKMVQILLEIAELYQKTETNNCGSTDIDKNNQKNNENFWRSETLEFTMIPGYYPRITEFILQNTFERVLKQFVK